MIKTEQPTKYDQYVDANCTLENYIVSSYGGLPNESMLEEQWNDLPDAIEGKSLRTILDCKNIRLGRPVRFYMNRLSDVTGVSATGKVLNGVVMPSGKVLLEWKQPGGQVAIYDNFKSFMLIHVESHPDSNEVVLID